MPCKLMTLPDGSRAIVCMGNRPRRRCPFCRRNWATLLCDFPLANGKTCDARICEECAEHVGPDRDHCPNHKGKEVPSGA